MTATLDDAQKNGTSRPGVTLAVRIKSRLLIAAVIYCKQNKVSYVCCRFFEHLLPLL
jgi:hypothetical protein